MFLTLWWYRLQDLLWAIGRVVAWPFKQTHDFLRWCGKRALGSLAITIFLTGFSVLCLWLTVNLSRIAIRPVTTADWIMMVCLTLASALSAIIAYRAHREQLQQLAKHRAVCC